MTDQITAAERTAIEAATEAGITKTQKPGRARGVNKRTAPMTATKPTKAQRNASKPKPASKPKAAAPKAKATGNTFTTVDLAREQGIEAKTLRARIRRNIDAWQPLFKDGAKHTFADNKTTRTAVAKLLA